MSKRVWAMVLAVAMVVSLMVFPVSADTTTGTEGYLSYSITDGEVTITDCDTSASGDLEIPDTIEGYPVTTIGSSAFWGCTSLVSITISDSVTSIGSYAFYGCTALTDITIPGSVTQIRYFAFNGCTCLTDIAIPSSVTNIASNAFYGCTSLTSITVSDSNENYMSEDGVLYDKEQTTLIRYPEGKVGSYIIPYGVTSIGGDAFSDCTGLTSIEIPDSVISIGSNAFWSCTSLTSATIGNSVTSIDYSTFWGCTSLTSITIPDSVTSIGERAFYRCTSLVSTTIGKGVTSIGSYAFSECTGLISVEIPDSVTSIDSYAFDSCANLASAVIGSGVTSINIYAFSGCTSLTSITVSDDNANYMSEDGVLFNKAQTALRIYPAGKSGSYTIPDGVTSIGESAFAYCSSLISVTIPDSVTSIGKYAFYYCTGLASIIFKGGAPTFVVNAYDGPLGSFAFSGVTATAYYPADNDTWTSSVMQDYGGTITWVAYDPDSPCITGHTEGEAVIENEVAATETEDGSYDIVVYCTVCGEELSRETVIVPATGSTDPEPTEPTDPEPTDPDPTEPTDPEPAEENPFTDVDETNYFYNAVLWAIENGITSGTSETTFSPYQEAERCQVVTFLWRAAGCPEVAEGTENPFTDVDEDDYFYTAVLWAVQEGITSGTTETTFSPFAKCERCQVVTFLYRYFDEPEVTTSENPFTDVDTDDYFYNAVLWAVENSVTSGTTDTTFGPFVTCERCMVVTFLYRALVE